MFVVLGKKKDVNLTKDSSYFICKKNKIKDGLFIVSWPIASGSLSL